MTPTDLINKWIKEAKLEYEKAKKDINLYKMNVLHELIKELKLLRDKI